jgi:hypothetical protein
LNDPLSPGVLMKAKKTEPFVEIGYDNIALYSVLVKKILIKDPWVVIEIIRCFDLYKPIFSKMLPRSLKKYLKSILNKVAQNR